MIYSTLYCEDETLTVSFEDYDSIVIASIWTICKHGGKKEIGAVTISEEEIVKALRSYDNENKRFIEGEDEKIIELLKTVKGLPKFKDVIPF